MLVVIHLSKLLRLWVVCVFVLVLSASLALFFSELKIARWYTVVKDGLSSHISSICACPFPNRRVAYQMYQTIWLSGWYFSSTITDLIIYRFIEFFSGI